METTINPTYSSRTQSQESTEDIRQLADFLDTRIQLPFGWRIGWDGIIGLIPGIGDVTTTVTSLYIVYRAAVLGCPLSVVLRMGLNILIDNLLDAIPLIGNIFDFMWKSNVKNISLLDQYQQSPHQAVASSKLVLFGLMGLMVLLLVATAVLTFYIARWLWGFFQTAW